jgi:hypothetical protein
MITRCGPLWNLPAGNNFAAKVGRERLKSEERNREPTPRADYAVIVARELHGLPVSPKELDRSQMQGIKGSQGDGPWIQGARENQRCHFKPSEAPEQEPDGFSVGISKPTRMDPVPYLVFRQAAGNEGVGPQTFGRTSVLGQ